MAGCRAPALQVCIPGGWCCILVAGGASLVVGGASMVAGGASLVAGGASLVAGGVILDGWWCIPGIIGRILQPGTQTGARAHSSVRRRSSLNGPLSGFFLIGYCSINQLFKFSYRMHYAKFLRKKIS